MPAGPSAEKNPLAVSRKGDLSMTCSRFALMAFGLFGFVAMNPLRAGVIFDSQNRFVMVDHQRVPRPTAPPGTVTMHSITTTSAPDFGPFSVGTYQHTDFTAKPHFGATLASLISNPVIQIQGDAYSSGGSFVGNIYMDAELDQSHSEVTFTLTDPTPYQANYYSQQLLFVPIAFTPVTLTGPGGQTIALNYGTVAGTLAPGQWTLAADAQSFAIPNATNVQYHYYDVTLTLPEPGSAMLMIPLLAAALRRRRVSRS